MVDLEFVYCTYAFCFFMFAAGVFFLAAAYALIKFSRGVK